MLIGAACKYVDSECNNIVSMNFGTISVKTASKLSSIDLHEALQRLVDRNLSALAETIRVVGALPKSMRMWRISSDLLPLATHAVARKFYARNAIKDQLCLVLGKIGVLARERQVRLSFHPAQFVVLGSPNLTARANSVREFEYHAEVAGMMGYTGWHPDGFAINVHVGGKNVEPKEFLRSVKSMSVCAQNLITLENDEFSWGARDILHHFGDHIPLVLDVHHYWIMHGRYISATVKNTELISETWRGVRPKLHLAMSRQHMIPEHLQDKRPVLPTLLEEHGLKRSKLRAHSDSPWNAGVLDYVKGFVDFDIMYEGKDKNLGQCIIARHLGLIN